MDVNAVNSMGLTALHGAANRGSDDIIQFLVDKGANRCQGQGRSNTADLGGRGISCDPSRPTETQLD